jgi:hypothetical protein
VCARLIAVNGNGQLRTHFCPHRHLCEPLRCRACEQARLSAGDDEGVEFATVPALAGLQS